MTLVTLVTLTGKSELVSQVVVISPGSVTVTLLPTGKSELVSQVVVTQLVLQVSQLVPKIK